MTFNIQYFAAIAAHTLHVGRAWTHLKLAGRARNAHSHDPVSTVPSTPLLSMLVSTR